MVQIYQRLLACLALFLLAACGSELEGPGETLRILASSLEPAYLGEEYSATLQTVGGLTPYTFEVSEGSLPPGLSLQGATLRGVPTQEGSYTFTVTVSDANLSRTFQEYSLQVTTPPPARLTLNVPNTDIQRSVTLRAVVQDARDLQGLRTQIRWDAELFQLVPDSVNAGSERYALFHEAVPGQLEVDLAVLGGAVSGERQLFTFALQPLEPTTLELAFDTEYLGGAGGNAAHAYSSEREGVASPLSRSDEAGEDPEDTPPDAEDPENGPGEPDDGDPVDGEDD